MARKVIGLAKNAVGRRGSTRRRWAFLVTLMVIVGAGLLVRQTLFAVHDTGAFQLDGDADSASQPFGSNTDDWDKVCYAIAVKPTADGGLGLSAADAEAKCGVNAPTTGASAVTWVEELNAASTIFTGGGSKDPQDISNWRWKDDANNPPDKDNLVHAYAARYQLDPDPATCPAGTNLKCDVIFFGSDRFDNSGDAHQAFWFLQQQVTLTNDSANGGFKFDGLHTPGDVLIISGFSNGGTTSTISVYKWDPLCLGDNKPALSCDAENLRLLANLQGAAAKCSDALGGTDIGCGIVNPDLITMPWTFVDKSNTPNNGAINGEFFEAGINLSDPSINLSGECFSTVVAETRSSTSPTAVLKDFVIGQFAVCEPSLTTTASTNGTVTPGTAVTDRAIVTVTGATNPDDATGTVQFSWCTATAAAPTCASGNTTPLGSPVALSNAACSPASPNGTDGLSCAVSPTFSPTTPGYYCFQAVATLTNYGAPTLTHTNQTTECFRVADTSTTTTAQRWVPNDEVTVLKGAGGAASGTVVFEMFESADCTGTAVYTSPKPVPLDANGKALSQNVNAYVSPGITISWKVTFTSSDPNVGNSVGTCEKSVLVITD